SRPAGPVVDAELSAAELHDAHDRRRRVSNVDRAVRRPLVAVPREGGLAHHRCASRIFWMSSQRLRMIQVSSLRSLIGFELPRQRARADPTPGVAIALSPRFSAISSSSLSLRSSTESSLPRQLPGDTSRPSSPSTPGLRSTVPVRETGDGGSLVMLVTADRNRTPSHVTPPCTAQSFPMLACRFRSSPSAASAAFTANSVPVPTLAAYTFAQNSRSKSFRKLVCPCSMR